MAESVLVIGASGLIGQYARGVLAGRGYEPVGTYFQNERAGLVHLDASDLNQVQAVFDKVRPTWVVNASSAAGGVDACERDPAWAERHHFCIVRNLVDTCKSHQSKLVHISTDYIFDGEHGPYTEDDPPNPIQVLGRIKLEAEEYTRAALPDSLIPRTTFVFDWDPMTRTPNFIMQMLRCLKRGETFIAPIDQVGNPTLAGNFAEGLVELLEQGKWGVFNLAGVTRCSKYDWAVKAAKCFGLDPTKIRGITTPELNQVAARPLQAGFVLDKVQHVLVRTKLLTLDEALAMMKSRMEF